jgi:hypothetical protein
MRARPFALAALALLVGALSPAGSPRASGSAPTLALTGADAFVTQSGARAVVATGSFNFDDRLQFGFPVGVIVAQGDRFARYDVSGEIVSATSPLVTDGIVATEIPTLLAIAATAGVPAALVQIRPDRLTVALPPEFSAGAATIVLYASKDNESFVSNPVPLELP